MLGAGRPQQRLLLGRPHDVDEVDAVGEAEPVQHLAEVGRRSRVHERRVTLATHRADETEHGQRVHEARRALDSRHPVGQLEALRHVDAPVLRVHRAAEHGDGLAEQGLGRVGRSRGDDRAGALVAHRQGVADTSGEGPQHRR